MDAAGGTTGAWRWLRRPAAFCIAGVGAVAAAAPGLAQVAAPTGSGTDPSSASGAVPAPPVRGAPTTGFGVPQDQSSYGASAPLGAPPAAAPAPGFGALGAGAQRPPGAASPAFPIRSFGDEPALENGAVGGALLGAAGAVFGRFYANAGLDALYDSNILRLGSSITPRPGSSRSDLKLTPQLEVGTNLPFGRQRFFASALFGRDYYLENDRLNRNRYRLGGGLDLVLGNRCKVTGDASFSSQQSLLSELSELVPNVQETLAYGAIGQCQTAGGLALGGTVRRQETRNDNPTRAAFDNNSFIYGPQLSYGRPTLGTFSISGTWTDADYPNRSVLVPSGSIVRDGVRIFQGRLGYARNFGPRLAFNGGVSLFRNEPSPATIVTLVQPGPVAVLVPRRSATTVGFDLAANYDSGNRLTAQVTASLANRVSLNVGARSQKRQAYGLDVGYRLGQRILLGFGANYIITNYQGSFTTPDETFARTQDKLFRVVGSIDYAPSKLYSVGLEVAHQRRDSDPAVYSFEATSVRLRLRLTYGRRG